LACWLIVLVAGVRLIMLYGEDYVDYPKLCPEVYKESEQLQNIVHFDDHKKE
jgi:hypothetical protein